MFIYKGSIYSLEYSDVLQIRLMLVLADIVLDRFKFNGWFRYNSFVLLD